jgi:transcription initiation factor TFIID subunit 7
MAIGEHKNTTSDRNRDIVRDRTLVLRVLVPGLHTRLNDKINTIQETAASSSSSGTTAAGGTAGGSKAIDQLFNLDGVTCLPSSQGSTLWNFR